jgi:hypothetical protein
MNFKELAINLAEQKLNKKFSFDLKTIAPDVIKDLDDFFDLDDGVIEFDFPVYSVFDEKTINIDSKYLFKRIFKKAEFNISITFLNTKNKIDYIITIEPEGSWERFVGHGVINILKDLRINLDNAIFYFTSLKSPIELEFDDNGDKLYYEVIPNGIYNIATHFKSEILEGLGLKDNLFQINPLDKTISKKVKCEISLLEIITFEATEIVVHSFDTITVKGNCTIMFMPGQKPVEIKNGEVLLSLDTFTLETKIPNELMVSNKLPGIKVWNVNLKFGGSLLNKTYTYGASGNFGTTKDNSKNTANADNSFEIQYSNLNTTPVPALFDGKMKELTLNKAIEMLTGENPKFPKFFDEVLSFKDLNIYWCTQPGFFLRTGIEAPVGFGVFSEFKLIGIHGYSELYYYQEAKEVKGLFLVEPIKIPGIIEIGGNSEGYKNKVSPGGMQFTYRVEDGNPQFEASIKTKILNKIEALNATGKFNKNGLTFSFKETLPFAPATFKVTVTDKGDITLNTKLKLSTPKQNLKLEPLGKIKLQFSVSCEGDLKIKAGLFQSFNFKCEFELFGKTIPINVELKKEQLDKFFDLPALVLEEIKKKLEEIFDDALEWLKGVIQGVIKIAENLKDEALLIAKHLTKKLGDNAKKIVDFLKKAGASCKLATLVLSDGFKKGPTEVAKLLKEAEYKGREIVQSLKEILEQSPKEIFKILNEVEFSYKEIGKAFSGMSSQLISYAKKINLDVKYVSEMLNGMGKTTDEAVKILTKRFDIKDNKALAKILKQAKFDAGEIEKSFRDVLNIKIRVKKPSGKIFGQSWSL